ncbi:N-alpha-acetyltransferase 30, partial [Chytridiales sp. JEL 0842]
MSTSTSSDPSSPPLTDSDPILQPLPTNDPEITYVPYTSESQLQILMDMIQRELSEPYSIYTYRYFLVWPQLCFLAMSKTECVGVIICKIDPHKDRQRGYIGMLAVSNDYRKRGIGSHLVRLAIRQMQKEGADEVSLETECVNMGAVRLYEGLGFVRDKKMVRYYLNGNDAY